MAARNAPRLTLVATVLLSALALAVSAGTQAASLAGTNSEYDGKVHPTGDGREIAYMIPPFAGVNHASFLVQLPSGAFVMAWFSGTKEGANDVSIVVAHLPSGGTQWTPATVTSQREGYSNQNPVLFLDTQRGVLHLFHSQQPANKGEDNASVWHLISKDGQGLPGNWTTPVEIFAKPGSFIRNRMVVRLDRSWLLPMYYARGTIEQNYAHIKTSDTQGLGLWGNIDFTNPSYLVQPSVIRPVPGKPNLITYFRDRRAQHIYRADSSDDGATWTSPQKTQFPNNNAGIEANVLANGNLVLCFNPMTAGRYKIAIALSEDGGKTWPYSRLMEDNPEKRGEYSYPTVMQSPDGKIHVSYTYLRQTIKYTVLDEAWIKGGTNVYAPPPGPFPVRGGQ